VIISKFVVNRHPPAGIGWGKNLDFIIPVTICKNFFGLVNNIFILETIFGMKDIELKLYFKSLNNYSLILPFFSILENTFRLNVCRILEKKICYNAKVKSQTLKILYAHTLSKLPAR
jgi:hypothetical protein